MVDALVLAAVGKILVFVLIVIALAIVGLVAVVRKVL